MEKNYKNIDIFSKEFNKRDKRFNKDAFDFVFEDDIVNPPEAIFNFKEPVNNQIVVHIIDNNGNRIK